MSQLRIAFENLELSEKDGKTEFVASLPVGKYNGINITLEELQKAAPSWLGADVLLGHSDTIIGEISYSAIENEKLIQKGTLEGSRITSLVKAGKLKPSVGASSKFERRGEGIFATDIKGDHLALVRKPACKSCTIRIAMSEALELVYKTTDDLPENIKTMMPADAQDVFMTAYNSAMMGTCKDSQDIEECCMKVAWAAVKNAGYEKQGKKYIKMSGEDETFIKSFRAGSGTEGIISMTEDELKTKHEIELKDLKLKHESEIKDLNLKLESTEKELARYKESEKLALAEKLTGAELKLGRISQDKHAIRIEELKKLELTEIREKYVLALEELSEKLKKGQGKVELGEQTETKVPTIGSYDPFKKEWI